MRWLKILNELAKIVAQISEIIYDFLLVKTYLAGNDGYKFLLVFPPRLHLLTLDYNKELLTNYQLVEYHLKQLNHLILILPKP